jgi:hypothetical protein
MKLGAVIPALRRWRQEESELQPSLGYREKLCLKTKKQKN